MLTLHPLLNKFTDIMSGIVPAISVFSGNVPQESVKLIYSLSWAMLPFWVQYYGFKTSFIINDQEVSTKILEILKKSRYPKRTQLRLMLLAPSILIGYIWVVWTGFAFEGGGPAIYQPVTYTNNLFIAFWAYTFSQSFLISITLLLVHIRTYPLT